MPDTHEASGEDVFQEALEELRCGEALDAAPVAMGAVLVVEAHVAVLQGDETLVSDGDPVRVAAEIAQDLFRAGSGRLGVDVPRRSRGLTQ